MQTGRRVPWLVLAPLLAAGPAVAGPAHEHGVARLDLAVDGRRVTLELELPLESLLGFERAPRNAAERRAADAALATLRDGAALFRFDAPARCTPAGVEIESAALAPGVAAKPPADGHAELRASWRFDCAGGAPQSLEQRLFDAFGRLARIEVQVAAERRQARVRLERPLRSVGLPR